jgi:pantoate--beta-alanine ligase
MIDVFKTAQSFIEARNKITTPTGLIATMGNLHAGHISLLEKSFEKYEVSSFTIFVNPKQFGPKEDFNKYPRTLENDIELIQKSLEKHPGKKVLLFAPADPKEIYPEGFQDSYSVLQVTDDLEGALRPGHFDGVATVVHRLFEITRPETAYFGLKDYQQYLVIRQMVKDLMMPIVVEGMPIIREASGLAMSSRNQYLSPEEREAGLIISRSIKEVIKHIDHKKENIESARAHIKDLMKDTNWNYLEIRDADNFSLDTRHSKKLTILGVYQLRTTRLLDNMQTEIQ